MKFSTTLKTVGIDLNHEGAASYQHTPEMELYTAVVTMALQDKFYETATAQIERVARLIRQVSPEFVAKLAVYTRSEMYLRSIPLLLVVELAKVHSGDDLVSRTVEKVIQRADEIPELLMCYQWCNQRPGVKKLAHLSHQIQVGLQRAFNKFDEYQFAKYDRDTEVKLRDALFLVHPKAKDEAQQAIFDRIVSRTLATPYTWEAELSALGQQTYATPQARQRAFLQKWTELVESDKVGYMALMRNLRNMLDAGVTAETIEKVACQLSDKHKVEHSKQFPFRYLSAYRELQSHRSIHTSTVLSALEAAVLHSAANIKGFDTSSRVLLACDTSGSMWSKISPKSTITCYDVGLMLAMLFQSRCRQVITGAFASEWRVYNMPRTSILSNTDRLRNITNEVGCGTCGEKPLQWLIKTRTVVDKVMMFTDCQFWNSSYGNHAGMFTRTWLEYKKIAPHARLYLFDLAGYGQTPISMQRHDVTCIAGWSDRIFDILYAIEHGSTAIESIMRTEL